MVLNNVVKRFKMVVNGHTVLVHVQKTIYYSVWVSTELGGAMMHSHKSRVYASAITLTNRLYNFY
jgi:hypothetical protein